MPYLSNEDKLKLARRFMNEEHEAMIVPQQVAIDIFKWYYHSGYAARDYCKVADIGMIQMEEFRKLAVKFKE